MTPPIEVLIVEDDPRIAEINRRFTEKVEGFVVVGMAKTGEEAEDWLEVMEPHLLLLDIYLPDMRGRAGYGHHNDYRRRRDGNRAGSDSGRGHRSDR